MSVLTTVGYEQADIDKFVVALLSASVGCVIDVRELPLSRKPGFSKTALSEALGRVGIEYLHLKALGDPKPGRDAARAGRFNEFNEIYREHLATPAAQSALIRAAGVALETKSCLLCYERNPEHCHRKVVADTLSQSYNLNVHHLFVNDLVTAHEQRKEKRIGSDIGKGGASPQPTAW